MAERSAIERETGHDLTLLFAGIEEFGRIAERRSGEAAAIQDEFHVLASRAISGAGGSVFKRVGELVCAVFPRASGACTGAVELQRAVVGHPWSLSGGVRARIALYTGRPEVRDGDYFGPPVNRVARLLAATAGGQIVAGRSTAAAATDLPAGLQLIDLGEHRFKDLLAAERVFQVCGQGLPATFPPLRSLDRARTNLPPQPTALIGRDADVARIRELLAGGVRLATLTGPGGTGKTRLALQAAAEEIENWADGVWFVPLATVIDPAFVIPAIAEVLGVRESGGESLEESLAAWLRDRRVLLVIDNLEQLLAAAPVLERLLDAAPRCAVIATSRAPLQLYGECEVAVAPLAVPEHRRWRGVESIREIPSVVLFTERAIEVAPTFELDETNGQAVAALCVRLEGLPLALELAAARSGMLSPAEILVRLEQRLAELPGEARGYDPRQRTLRATIEWSYALLPAGHQRVFSRLAVLAGGELDTIEAIAAPEGEGDIVEAIEGLVIHSLLRREETGDGPRFVMLETIREFAAEVLASTPEATAIRTGHAGFFTSYAERAEIELNGADQVAWYPRVAREHDNIRGALGWLTASNDGDRALRLAGALWRFWWVRGHLTEGSDWLGRVLALPGGAQPLNRAKALDGYGALLEARGDLEGAATAHREALDLARTGKDAFAIARALDNLGIVAEVKDDLVSAEAYYRDALAQRRSLGEAWPLAVSLLQLSGIELKRARYDEAERLAQECLDICREIDSARGITAAVFQLGKLKWRQSASREAVDFFREALERQRELGDEVDIPNTLVSLGRALARLGELDEAERAIGEALPLFVELGDKDGEAWARIHVGELEGRLGRIGAAVTQLRLSYAMAIEVGNKLWAIEAAEAIANLLAAQGLAAESVMLFGAADALRAETGFEPGDTQVEDRSASLESARQTLTGATFALAWERGRSLTLERAMTEVEPVLSGSGW